MTTGTGTYKALGQGLARVIHILVLYSPNKYLSTCDARYCFMTWDTEQNRFLSLRITF